MEQASWLLQLAGTIVVFEIFVYILSGTKSFRGRLAKASGWEDQLILALLFGGFAIFNTSLGVKLPTGAIVNVRDMSPVVAGLAGGPLVGLVAGLIGGVHRFTLGGLTGVPCALGTVLGGLIAGGIYKVSKDKLVGFWWALVIGAVLESLDMGLILIISQPFSEALAVVTTIIVPMVVANAAGVAIAQQIIARRGYKEAGA